MRYQFYTADVFTDRIFGGNQLAVFPDGLGLVPEQMQLIAKEINYSETVFVLPPADPNHTRRLRIFTPGAEVPFAGHPTVGTAFVLAAIKALPLESETTWVYFEEGVGTVPVAIRTSGGFPTFTQLTAAQPPEYGPEPPAPEALAEMLSLSVPDLLLGDYPPQAVSAGLPFLFVPLKSMDAVRRAWLRREVWERVLRGYWAEQVYVFSFETEYAASQLHARMFGPAVGVAEDPATGSAAAALPGYLGPRTPSPTALLHWVAEQGFEMGRPSILDIEADKQDGRVTGTRVGGQSVLVSEGTMDVPVLGATVAGGEP